MNRDNLKAIIRRGLYQFDRPAKFLLEDCLPRVSDWVGVEHLSKEATAVMDRVKSNEETQKQFLTWIMEQKVEQLADMILAYAELEEGFCDLLDDIKGITTLPIIRLVAE